MRLNSKALDVTAKVKKIILSITITSNEVHN